ncbi:MAG TPA: YoaK family protein [Candidatus Dormibacteraeota bacterium]|nr:YoaK family protein [Candidatus Dormibacteraeota bacterium]
MSSFLAEIRGTLVPGRDSRHGPLPPLLLAMTLVTGLVDAFSYLLLGHVFVANMTGNVVLLGFALVGAPGFSIAASVVAGASFALGALVGGRVGSRLAQHRGRLLSVAATVQAALFAAAVVLAVLSGPAISASSRYALIVILGLAMGIQNAAARTLAVPDLTTTVLTMTITGIAADSTIAGGKGSRAGRRLTALVAMLAGAVIGAALVLYVHIVYPLAIALGVTVVVAATSGVVGRSNSRWTHADG